MGHIHDKPGQVDQTVTAYIVRRDGDEIYVMLHRHKKLGKLLPVGGHIELDETPWSAMAHELTEESGYLLDELDVLQPSLRIKSLKGVVVHPQPVVVQTHTITPKHFHTDMSYLFVAEAHPRGKRAAGESDDIRWLTRDGIERLSDDEIYDNTRQTCLAILDQFLNKWQPVPAKAFMANLPTERV